jgi:hypothetical protein
MYLMPNCQENAVAPAFCRLQEDAAGLADDAPKNNVSTDAGLPDGLVSIRKSQFGQIFEGLRWENVAIYFMVICNILQYHGNSPNNISPRGILPERHFPRMTFLGLT